MLYANKTIFEDNMTQTIYFKAYPEVRYSLCQMDNTQNCSSPYFLHNFYNLTSYWLRLPYNIAGHQEITISMRWHIQAEIK